ncbi:MULTISPECIES: Acg family FMN-binding oxidoreductase [Streptomyces]|uniref:Acg family FMN-binding oxidoreductase n=1 Tax=Streptomyces TaxID=1883 RepID=UPI00136CD99D|nr:MULTISPECIES: nitroreductase family protein [unclassified Streptomyces]MYY80149.1 nitroreductase [Streptomyces sp. SID335]NDZ85365.1 nitroreductase [Streptomyces sp. SID10115]NEA00876.1 nitroreductase [Streptomyces sp. SID10116]NEB46524.1 nitroreductase [Streptomyces sp. SID339]
MASRLDDKTVVTLVAEATAAPSMHNAQPWRFRFLAGEQLLRLYADPERAMPHSDPDNRALHIGCGAALLNLRVAAAHAGLRPETRLLPDPRDPALLASVRLVDPAENPQDDDLTRLHPAIRQRHTSRHPFADKELPEDVRTVLRDAAALEGAELSFPDSWHAETVLDLVRDAESRDVLDPDANEDLVRWTRLGDEADIAVDGVPEYAFGPRKRDGQAPVRDFAGRRRAADRGTTSFEQTPHLVLLSTPGDRPADWLRAGQALERVLLEATLADLATSLTSHALEDPGLRLLARDPDSGHGQVQMVLRIGYGPRGPSTPRRRVADVLETG